MNYKTEQEARELLVAYGHRLLETGLVQGTWGNLSVRTGENTMMVTPSGLNYEDLGPEDMVLVDLDTLKWEGVHKPTSERSLHAGIYLSRPEIGAIVHTHSKYCAIYAACQMPMLLKGEEGEILGERILCAKYALSGTKQLAKQAQKALGQNNAVFLAHHGMIACGEDMERAFANALRLEKIAEASIEKRWARIGSESPSPKFEA